MSKSITRKGLFERGPSASSGTIGVSSGGTGITSYAVGDLIYASGATTLSKLAIGTANQQLRVNAGATALEYFTPTGGISIGDAIGNSPVTGSVLMVIGTTLTQSISYRAQQATPFSTAFGFESHSSGSFSGINNTSVGYNAGKVLTTGTNNLFIGYNAGVTILSGSSNVFLGSEAGGLLTANNISNNVFIGYTAGQQSSGGNNVSIGESTGAGVRNNNTSVGARAGFARTSNQDDNALFGYYAGGYQNGNYCTFLGSYAGFASGFGGSAVNFSIALGYNARVYASNQMVIGYTDATSYIGNVYFNGVTSSTPQPITINSAGGLGTNIAGANLTHQAGLGTGTAAGGIYKTRTAVKTSSGTTLQSATDRLTQPAKYVDITGGAATVFGNLALATSGTVAGGTVIYTIEANDGTDYQALSGVLKYDVVNKAGTLTVVYEDDQNGTGACSSGTLSATVDAVASGTNVTFRANAVSDLAETVLRVSFQVLNNYGVATITPA